MSEIVEGRNPVLEAIKSERNIDKILILDGKIEGSAKKIVAMAKQKRIKLDFVPKAKLNEISLSDNHQGVIAYVSDYRYYELDELIDKNKTDDIIIICDEIKDPHNLGAIIRTADAVGVSGVIIPSRRSTNVTPVVVKTSAGATEYIKVAKVTNISRSIEKLKQSGYWIVGTDVNGDKNYFDMDLKGKIVIVIGSEGDGMSRIVRQNCDFLVRIPMMGGVTSLNASVSAGILMYEALRQRLN